MTFNPQHLLIQSNNITLHCVAQGDTNAPLVICCHGFPGLWYSWRHQLTALAAAGYLAVAIDQRGYGRSDRPSDPARYDSNTLVADTLGVLDHFNREQAIFIGHDFGAALVYNIAVRHPERVTAVVGVACPYDFDLAGRGCAGANPPAANIYNRAFARPDKYPSECFAEIALQHFYHMHWYQSPDIPEQALAPNAELFLRRLFWALSADGNLLDWTQFPMAGTSYVDVLAEPAKALPWSWMTKADLDYYVSEFCHCDIGKEFIGGINSYRTADRNWEIGLAYADHNIVQPSLYITGSEDPVRQMIGEDAMAAFKARSTDLRGIKVIPNAGHFVQMEQAVQFNQVLLQFLQSL
ncbi:alpha/beta fold hydrolase [Oceanicoccus sp. KOV_DT_Chl]|uniref:alpha/beta fold hydrolase n=1 Tax=Oceanicoccus sp. KOV_DT_Chl TaxID=1904639 RepID=UPI000C7DD5CF|nr:alpha/beta hydrolase [Oceanicoccus sp. KOV_DT_Chl]